MIWLQYKDANDDAGGGEFHKHVYEDKDYELALDAYEVMKGDWELLRIILESNTNSSDWVTLKADGFRGFVNGSG